MQSEGWGLAPLEKSWKFEIVICFNPGFIEGNTLPENVREKGESRMQTMFAGEQEWAI